MDYNEIDYLNNRCKLCYYMYENKIPCNECPLGKERLCPTNSKEDKKKSFEIINNWLDNLKEQFYK